MAIGFPPFPQKGNGEIRIYDRAGEEGILMLANSGGIEDMREEFAAAIDTIPYPIQVEDRSGFSYANPAYFESHPQE